MTQHGQLGYMYSKKEQDGCPGTRATLNAVFGVCGKVLAVKGCRGGFCEKKQGLPCVRHRCFQLVPSGSNGPTIGHSCHTGGTSGKNVFKKGQKTPHRQTKREQK